VKPAWAPYLARFHTEHAGVTEAVLSRLQHPEGGVGDWLLDAVDQRGRVLDVACGSAPLWSRLRDRWVGIDRSGAELALARARGAAPVVCADASALPIAAEFVETIVCAMGLMLFEPLERAVSELARVIGADGRLVALLPDTRPLPWRDRLRYARMLVALRRRRFAYPQEPKRVDDALDHACFDVIASERRSFRYPIDEPEHARLLVDALYLPGTSDERIVHARAVAERWIGTSIAVPLRRLVAIRRVTLTDAGGGGPPPGASTRRDRPCPSG
jgi:SAM-dependent methyltransferase